MHTKFTDLNQAAFQVVRVETQSSVYLLGTYMQGGRRFLVLRGAPGTDKADVLLRDSDPRVGERSLWDVPVPEWVGQQLQVATMTTTAIKAASVERDAQALEAIRGVTQIEVAPVQQARSVSYPEPPPRAYPESHVEYAEDAAACLRALLRTKSLFVDVAREPLLADRLRLALSACVISLEGLRLRAAEDGPP